MRTLMDNNQANRPQRRTALVGKELGRYNVDIAVLSETRLAEEGQLKERGASYTFFWSGQGSKEPDRLHHRQAKGQAGCLSDQVHVWR